MSASFRADLAVLLLAALPGCLDRGAPEADMIDGSAGTSNADTSETPSEVPSGSSSDSGSTGSSDSTGPNEPMRYSFLADPDGGDGLNECSPWLQNCPAGEKCMPRATDGGSAWNTTTCSPIAPDPAQPGEPCTVEGGGASGIDDCDVASMCWGVDPETSTGECVAFCVGSPADPICENPDNWCAISGSGDLILCLPACDPLAQGCPEGEGCYGIYQSFSCRRDASGDAGSYGTPCEYLDVCDPGFACIGPEWVPGCEASYGCCTRYCSLDDTDAPCEGGLSCIPWFGEGEAPPGLEDLGVCVVPV